MGTLVDLTGRRFGRWFVTQRNEPPTVGNKAMWLCRCDCGVIKSVASNLLMHGRSLSCGCWNGDSKRTHGMSKTVEYRTWAAMKERCVNEGHASFDDYGGRGIQVCDRWLSSFETFYQDMGPRPSAEHSIERTDHNGNYEPGNCVWADWDTQANNRRNNVRFDYQGRNLTLSQCAEAMGVSKQTLRGRLRAGFSIDQAAGMGLQHYHHRLYTHEGETKSLAEWAVWSGVKVDTLYYRVVVSGWTMERALQVDGSALVILGDEHSNQRVVPGFYIDDQLFERQLYRD